ncbi:MAG: SpoIIE family protein phosphatase [Thermoleophilia bacterium]|nr:SpoIIE family protein phosphatase [Thermoleophilia bacterium]
MESRETIREDERHYRTLFEQAPDGILIIDPETRLPLEFNDAACQQLGYSRKQFHHVRIDDYEVDHDGDAIDSHIEKVLSEGEDSFSTRHRVRNGELRDVFVMIKPIEKNGKRALHCVFRDVTSKRRAESLNRSLIDINTAVNSSLDLEEITRIAMTRAAFALKADSANIGIHDGEGWVTTYAHGPSTSRKGYPFGVGAARIADTVSATKKPVVIADSCQAAGEECASFCEEGIKSILAIPIILRTEVVGIMCFMYNSEGLDFGEDLLHFCGGVANAVSMAMENARLYQNEIEARKNMENHARRLAALHDISLLLNSETAVPRLFNMILEAAARVTNAGVGVMTMVKEDRTSVIAEYYAPWYGGSCRTSERDVSGLHHRIVRLVGPVRDAVRIDDLGDLQDRLNFPEGHPPLRGLLIGTIRDHKGMTRGHFMLSSKADGQTFTAEDEEIISVLATQSSVAITSAENLKREKIISDALQNSLLTGAPVREDLDVGFVYQSPSSEGRVGGDFYDFHALEDGSLLTVVGDVCGKGLKAATYTAMVKYMLKAFLSEGYEPGECLTRLNAAVSRELDIDIFVTLFLVKIDASMRKIAFASAGHPSPLICVSRQEAAPMEVSAALPLGIVDDHEFITHERYLDADSTMVLFTDGLMEARAPGGKTFGMGRLAKRIGTFSGTSQELAETLLEGAILYSGGVLRDDIAVVVIKVP